MAFPEFRCIRFLLNFFQSHRHYNFIFSHFQYISRNFLKIRSTFSVKIRKFVTISTKLTHIFSVPFKHVFRKDTVAFFWMVYENMGNGADQPSVLEHRRAGISLYDAAGFL